MQQDMHQDIVFEKENLIYLYFLPVLFVSERCAFFKYFFLIAVLFLFQDPVFRCFALIICIL